jgi:hypothetical protein
MRKMLLLLSVALAISSTAATAMPTGATAAEAYYCGELVPAYTDCAVNPGHYWDYYNGYFYVNAAESYGEGTVNVCEHVYDLANRATVSDRCKNGFAASEGDLGHYWEFGIELSGHSGNNSGQSHTIYGTVVH